MAPKSQLPKIALRGIVVVTLLVALFVGTALVAIPIVSVGSPAEYVPPWSLDEELELEPLAQTSHVYARDGSQLATLHAEENRMPVELTEVAPVLVDAVLAAEDQNFYSHGGVNAKAMARAFFVNINVGTISQGGSTITQQVVKNSFLTPERSVNRKLREMILARKLEEKMSKDAILERYLNTIYLGNGAYGVKAGAEVYFGKSPSDLTAGEAALLAGLIRSPGEADPISEPESAKRRRSAVLSEMVYQGKLTPAAKVASENEPIPRTLNLKPQIIYGPGDYFAEWVKQVLLRGDILGETPTQRYNALFKGGLTIETTLDPGLQQLAEKAVDDYGPRGSQFTAALASVETKTGAVRALVGGRDFKELKYNLATQGVRGTGSSFKIFTLVAAFQNGVAPEDAVDGTGPCNLKMPGGGIWKANNYAGEGGGVMSVRQATAKSVNCAFARMILTIGVDKVIEAGKAMGLPEPIKSVPSITLGTQEVAPVDMAASFATLPTGGIRHRAYYVERITGPKGVIFEQEKEGEQTVDKCVALTAVDVMRSVVTGGTGGRASIGRQPVAGKTGTGEKYRDAWFVGFTPHLSTAVWVGSPEGEISMYGVNGFSSVAGGTIPAIVFSAFMGPAHSDLPIEDFERPACKLKGGALKRGTATSDGNGSGAARDSTPEPPAPAPPAPAPPAVENPPAPAPTKPAPTKPAPTLPPGPTGPPPPTPAPTST